MNNLAEHPSPQTIEAPVTRIEVIDHLKSAFDSTAATKSDLLAEARNTGARAQVVELLQSLPERRFLRPNELWTELPDVPIEV